MVEADRPGASFRAAPQRLLEIAGRDALQVKDWINTSRGALAGARA